MFGTLLSRAMVPGTICYFRGWGWAPNPADWRAVCLLDDQTVFVSTVKLKKNEVLSQLAFVAVVTDDGYSW